MLVYIFFMLVFAQNVQSMSHQVGLSHISEFGKFLISRHQEALEELCKKYERGELCCAEVESECFARLNHISLIANDHVFADHDMLNKCTNSEINADLQQPFHADQWYMPTPFSPQHYPFLVYVPMCWYMQVPFNIELIESEK